MNISLHLRFKCLRVANHISSQIYTMGLEDFERELAESKSNEQDHRSKHKSRDEGRERKHRHHHRSHRHRDDEDRERRHRHKRHREDDDEDARRHRKRRRSSSRDPPQPAKATKEDDVEVFDSPNASDEEEDEWIEKETTTAPPEEDILDQRDGNLKDEKVQRDAWMQEPSGLEIENVRRKKPEAPKSQFVTATNPNEFTATANQNFQSLAQDFEDSGPEDDDQAKEVANEPAQHEVAYMFGDSGSSWRMTKLKAVYRQAKESGRDVDDVALERYGDLRDFDDAREEERELERREMYGKEYVGLEKPSGELFQERKMDAGVRRSEEGREDGNDAEEEGETVRQGERMPEQDRSEPVAKTAPLDSTALNKLKAQLMKAKLRNAPDIAKLEEEYNAAVSQASLANSSEPGVVVLNNMESRSLAGGRAGEVTAVTGKRGRERGLVVENEDMSIEDMVRQEKRSKGAAGGEGRAFAERIAKDGKFKDDLDYMDDNANNLSKKVMKSDTNLKNAAIGDFRKTQKVLANCPLCYHEDNTTDPTPLAPVVSLATRTYLTLPTEPEIAAKGSPGGAVIVPIQHHNNLLECDDDEWEELRNFQKSLTRFYASLPNPMSVLFYENAAHFPSRRSHAALNCVPIPSHLLEQAPAYFKEAILAEDERWSQHKPIIDTLALARSGGAQGGRNAFRKAMVKELPYFHVWFGIEGGMGHVVEDERRWPKGDLFAREILGGMLGKGPEVISKQGRWQRGAERARVERFRKKWAEWDWTKALVEEG